jgi:hypothetical protein
MMKFAKTQWNLAPKIAHALKLYAFLCLTNRRFPPDPFRRRGFSLVVGVLYSLAIWYAPIVYFSILGAIGWGYIVSVCPGRTIRNGHSLPYCGWLNRFLEGFCWTITPKSTLNSTPRLHGKPR